MNSSPEYRPVYRSVNKILTIWSVERKLFFCILLLAAAMFQGSQNLLPSLGTFGVLWVAARAATQADPQMLKVLINSSRFVPRYDPAYQDEGQPHG
jgi:type IV secretory pathway TrbD component